MKSNLKLIVLHIITCFWTFVCIAQKPVIVDIGGHGDFFSIQDAINSLSDDAKTQRVIFVKNGQYNEKLLIEKNNILIKGESRSKVVITQSISRDEFRCEHPDDWGVATVNVNGNDVTLANMTIRNGFGFDFTTEKIISCANDTAKHEKKITKTGHQMALRTMKATRFAAVNCTFSSYGGDTVSPWNVDNGYFYFKNCRIEGGVDLYCPRGWAWADSCEFYAYNGAAILWHDGSKHKESISVLHQCHFDGYKDFYLGRYHRDAQMLLMDCRFSDRMKDSAIYHVNKSTDANWGNRIYLKNCKKESGNFKWFSDNSENAMEADLTILKKWMATITIN